MPKIILLLIFTYSVFAFAEGASDVQVPDITVFGSEPTSSTLDLVPTVSELSGTRLERKRKSTIGETLSQEPGVASSEFGPNASRPVIRGMDGDRVRILQNGTGVLDASAASQDHAVAVDPIIVDRIEVVRGGAALLYGSQAVGGVVNLVTNRIPEKVPEKTEGKITTQFSSTDLGRAGAASVNTALGNHWVIHVDGTARGADDYHVNGYPSTPEKRAEEAQDPETADPAHDRVLNSQNYTSSEALAASYVFANGYVGSSFSNYDSTYGTVDERFVHINMLQQRWDLNGEVRSDGFFKSIRFKNSFSHYKHDEVDHGEVASTFKNDGDEARVDIRHQAIGGFAGVFGAQANVFAFSADGDDHLLPKTNNSNYAVFAFEELEHGTWRSSFGFRLDSSAIASDDDPTFGPGQTKRFTGGSFSLGLTYQFMEHNSLVLNGAYTERAPNYEELFANGPHDATGQFEVGNTDLQKERSQSVELSWRHKEHDMHGSLGAFVQQFQDFISLTPTGAVQDDLDVYDYKSVNARFYGAEGDYTFDFPQLLPGGVFSVGLKADMVRAFNTDTKENLPRITPIREAVDFLYNCDNYQADLEVQNVQRQDLTDPHETPTDGYTMVNLGIEAPVKVFGSSLSMYGRLNNAFDVLARNHVSVLKDVAPLPGRNFIIGAQAVF